MDEKVYWLGFSMFPNVGPVRFRNLLADFGSAKDAWHASLADLKASSLGNAFSEKFDDYRTKTDLAAYVQELKDKHIEFLTIEEQQYPELLKTSIKPPFILYAKGNLDCLNNKKPIAVVGTRKVTEYGREVTEVFTSELAQSGCTIISGLALGVDSIAHRATLDVGGLTVAVLGSGVDNCTPRENYVLYNKILKSGGAIISEYAPGMEPTKGSFPSRNRIIAGMSLGVLVTEGAEDSGSLITANNAFENNRKVFAVPGPITSSVSRGPIALINKGAKMVMRAEEIVDELGIMNQELGTKKKAIRGDTKEEQTIIDLLENQSMQFDELVRQTGFNSSQVGTLLSLMEMKGIIKTFDSGQFAINA